jgi:TolA-binding protein
MKKKLLSGLLLLALLMTVISANPTQSQKQKPADSAPVAKSAEAVIAPVTDRISVLEEKAKGVEKTLDDDNKRADRMLYQVETLQARQGQILASFQKREVLPIPPISQVYIKAAPDSPEIKPVEPSKPSWWKRIFSHEKH